jgi:hypothetical protein
MSQVPLLIAPTKSFDVDSPGRWYVIAVSDHNHDDAESNELNNMNVLEITLP